MIYFYCVSRGNHVIYEGQNRKTAFALFEKNIDAAERAHNTTQVSMGFRPFEERTLGGSPQFEWPEIKVG